jgi:hypothetical protein
LEAARRKGVQEDGAASCVAFEDGGGEVPRADDVQDDATAMFASELENGVQQFGLLSGFEGAAQAINPALTDGSDGMREEHSSEGINPVRRQRLSEPRMNPKGGQNAVRELCVEAREGWPVIRAQAGDHVLAVGFSRVLQSACRVREAVKVVVGVVH